MHNNDDNILVLILIYDVMGEFALILQPLNFKIMNTIQCNVKLHKDFMFP